MDWGILKQPKRRTRRGSEFFGKSSSEPDLSGKDHFTPRFSNNLTKLIHEYVTVDELKLYRKRRPPNIEDEFHSKSNFSLYDTNEPTIPFSNLKTEYKKEFGKTHNIRSQSVPKKFGNLNATTSELIEALRDDDSDVITVKETTKRESDKEIKAKTSKIIGKIEIETDENFLKSAMKPYAQVRQPTGTDAQSPQQESSSSNVRSCTLKLEGELTYAPEYQSQFKAHPSIERSQSIPQMNHIKFHGQFHGTPEYKDSFQFYENFAKSAPIKSKNHLKVNPRINAALISPSIPQSSEYTEKFKEVNFRTMEKSKTAKQLDNLVIKNDLVVAHHQLMPEYNESFQDPNIRKMPERAKARDSILALSGSMEYNPEYRSTYLDFPRARPITKKPEAHFDFTDIPSIEPIVSSPISTTKYHPRVAVVEPSKNVHHPTGLDFDPTYFCQPEVRKARKEFLIRKRPPSPSKTIAAVIKSSGEIFPTTEEDDNKIYNEKSRIVPPLSNQTIHVTVENVDEPDVKPSTILSIQSPPKFGRRASIIDMKASAQKQRNRSKIIEGNRNYSDQNLLKKNSLSSTTTDDDSILNKAEIDNNSRKNAKKPPSFVILKEPCKQNKWMKTSWY